MVKEAGFDKKQVDSPKERKDHFMELMGMRHRNAMAMLEIEDILSQEEPLDENPNISIPENVRIEEKAQIALKPILDTLSLVGLTKKRKEVEKAVTTYLLRKVEAQRAELKWKDKLQKEGRGFDLSEMGLEMFKQRTGKVPKAPVMAERRGGYFVVVCYNDDDYSRFTKTDKNKSVGYRFRMVVPFLNMLVDVVASRDGFNEQIIAHERQHFINNSLLLDFAEIETHGVPSKKEFPLLAEGVGNQKIEITKKLGRVKDELLARIRGGSNSTIATNFFGLDFYDNLRNQFSEGEQEEVGDLLEKIRVELEVAFKIFNFPHGRGVLAYHLIDIPLFKFPERIRAVVEFYYTKMWEFEDFIPARSFKKDGIYTTIHDPDLIRLRTDIKRRVTEASNLIMGFSKINYSSEELQTKLGQIKEKIIKLRTEFDKLLAESV